MTLTTLLLYVAIAALGLTATVHFLFKKVTSWPMTFIQNFCGALFIFSGWVKAVDPLGTAYKMEQYFDQFETVFQGTWMNFISPLFPLLSSYSIGFSVVMIIFEIILGVMLIIGHKPRLTAWSFLLLVGFFTALTGFTYLTGYVPSDVNFFDFSSWSDYAKTNMKVTDCGCFGDFIKLEPKVSFFKDVFLLLPALYFLFKSSTMHSLFSRGVRNISLSVLTIGLFVYCLSNFYWDLPHVDFRPFRKDRDIRAQKALEDQSRANTKILFYDVTNKASKESKRIPYDQYLKTYKEYPSEEWNLEQIYSEPEVAESKISAFNVFDLDGNELNEEILNSEQPLFLIIAHRTYADGITENIVLKDTIYQMDTVISANGVLQVIPNIQRIDERTETKINYIWKGYYEERYSKVVRPFVKEALNSGYPVIMIVGGASNDQILDFEEDLQLGVRYATADDILLKTIVRSNPGIVLFKNGVLMDKWHFKKLPSYEDVKKIYLN